MPDKDDKLPARITGNGDDRAPVALPFRLRETFALPLGWPPDVAPNQVIASAHINQIRTSVAQWPADVDGMSHNLSNVHLVNATGVMTDPTTTAGDLITRNATVLARFPLGANGQVLTVDTAQATKLRWVTPAPVVASVFGRTGAVIAQAGDYTAAQVTNAVSLIGSYADPAWITQLSWSKLINVPGTFTPAPHTHDASAVVSGRLNTARLGAGLADETVYLRGDGVWSVVVGAGGGGGGGVTTVFGRIGNVVAQTGDYTAAQVSGAVVDPTIALGDLMVRSGTGVSRLPAGANGQVLQSDNTRPLGLKWITMGGGAAIPGGLNDGDTLQWKSGAWAVLAVGAVGQVLTVDTAGGLKWSVGAGGSQTPWLQDIDGGNNALTNVSTIVSNGAIRSIAGGFIFPDGSSMATALVQSPWTADIDAAGHALNNIGPIRATADLPFSAGGSERMRIYAAGHARFGGRVEIPVATACAYSGNLTFDGSSYRYIVNGSGFLLAPAIGESVLYAASNGTAAAVASVSARVSFKDGGWTLFDGNVTAQRGTASGMVGNDWAASAIDYRDVNGGKGFICANVYAGSDFQSSIFSAGSVNAGYGGSYKEWFGIRGNGSIQIFIGGSLKTISIDGSGFLKAA